MRQDSRSERWLCKFDQLAAQIRRALYGFSSRFKIVTSGVLILTLVVGVQTKHANASPNGATSTAEIALGAAGLAYLLTYEASLVKSKGSVSQANGLIRYSTPNQSEYVSLEILRALVINDVALASRDTNAAIWRDHYEHFRSCWNSRLSDMATPSPSPSPSSSSTNTSKDAAASANTKTKKGSGRAESIADVATRAEAAEAASASPAPTPLPGQTARPSPIPLSAYASPPGCDALLADQLNDFAPNEPLSTVKLNKGIENLQVNGVDIRDLAGAISSTPSVYQQVVTQRVGSYLTEDLLQANFLQIAANGFITEIVKAHDQGAQSETGATSDTTVQTFAKDCSIVTTSLFSCVSDLSSVESMLASSQSQRDACQWDRTVWLPSFTALRLWARKLSPISSADGSISNRLPKNLVGVEVPPPSTMVIESKYSLQKSLINSEIGLDLGSPSGC